jgi:hypothetical protein
VAKDVWKSEATTRIVAITFDDHAYFSRPWWHLEDGSSSAFRNKSSRQMDLILQPPPPPSLTMRLGRHGLRCDISFMISLLIHLC